MEIREYIASGVLESYVLGSASEEETLELLQLKKQYPEVRDALFELETDLERIAQQMSIPPPPGLLAKIEDNINALINTPNNKLTQARHSTNDKHKSENSNRPHYIEVEAESNHMRVHKTWKWIFAVFFALSKLFLIASIYYYLENRHAQEQIQELRTELKHYAPYK